MTAPPNRKLKDLRHQAGFVHARFGDLNDSRSVVIEGQGHRPYDVTCMTPLYIHLSVTQNCFARCKGCINVTVTSPGSDSGPLHASAMDTVPERDARCILNLARSNGKHPFAVCFYGGEPLLAADKIHRVCQILDQSDLAGQSSYMIYTNGELIQSAIEKYPDMMKNVWLYAVSIDGTAAQHDRVRQGTRLATIHDNLYELNKIRNGQVLMWSTLREEQSLQDCFDEFLFLHRQNLADHFFWHWVETDAPFEDFDAYVKNYEKDFSMVMATYIQWLAEGKILPIAHVNELITYILTGMGRNSSACGVELAKNYDLVNGKIHSCADLPLDMAIGHIEADGTPKLDSAALSCLVEYKKDLNCRACGVHSYCGGRCPVQAFTNGYERLIQYCQLMRLHVGMVQESMPDIARALKARNISLQDLYDQSAYYAQFTDVTP
ncbi:MAG: SPASM domain-containing protein [Desulfobacterales bacterium]|nr:SPASM domain-containing protein [Desulfobacterales bacterium]